MTIVGEKGLNDGKLLSPAPREKCFLLTFPFIEPALDSLQPIEMEDSARFERIRAAREKELRDPNDVFLQAEERRQELKRQKGRKRKPKRGA